MSTTVIAVGATEDQDPDAAIVRAFNWTDWLGPDANIASATVAVTASSAEGTDPAPVTIDNVAVLAADFVDGDVTIGAGKGVRFRAQGGTPGVKYTVTCHIATDEAVVQQDDRSFKIKIKER